MKKRLNEYAKIGETKTFIDADTGEEVKAETVVKKVDRSGFEITYIAYLCDLFEMLGNQKMKVLKYILENKTVDNLVIDTVRSISEKSGVSLQTVQRTLTILNEKGVISRRNGVMVIHPKIAHKGNYHKEKNIMIKFEEIKHL